LGRADQDESRVEFVLTKGRDKWEAEDQDKLVWAEGRDELA